MELCIKLELLYVQRLACLIWGIFFKHFGCWSEIGCAGNCFQPRSFSVRFAPGPFRARVGARIQWKCSKKGFKWNAASNVEWLIQEGFSPKGCKLVISWILGTLLVYLQYFTLKVYHMIMQIYISFSFIASTLHNSCMVSEYRKLFLNVFNQMVGPFQLEWNFGRWLYIRRPGSWMMGGPSHGSPKVGPAIVARIHRSTHILDIPFAYLFMHFWHILD